MKSRAQIEAALAQRTANAEAAASGRALPFPNPWDVWDPTKVPASATAEAITDSYRRFCVLCHKRPRKVHVL